MANDIVFRSEEVKKLSKKKGVYILADLDNVPIYVGRTSDTINARVRRHLTSARSDIIANRQVDVWEVAYVWEYPTSNVADMKRLEAALFHKFHPLSNLMNGANPPAPPESFAVPEPSQIIQVMIDEQIAERRSALQRLPRQAKQYADILGHFLAVKNSKQIAYAIDAHFKRLEKYHRQLMDDALTTKKPRKASKSRSRASASKKVMTKSRTRKRTAETLPVETV